MRPWGDQIIDTDIDTRSITQALNRIDDFGALGRVRLAGIRIVDEYLARTGTASTSFQRGRVLSRLIQRLIEEQALDDQRRLRGRGAVEWSILYLRVNEGRTLEEIAGTFSMPLRTVGRYYARAKGLLLDRLLSLDTPRTGELHCPLCGTAAGMDVTAGEYTCSRCGARMRVEESRVPAELVIHVRRPEGGSAISIS